MELEQKCRVDHGVFILKMNLSSDSETELDKLPETGVGHEFNNQMMDETNIGMKNEPKVVTRNESKILKQNKPEIDNCINDISSKAKAKWRVSSTGRKRGENWGWRDEIAIASAVRDGVMCGLDGVRSPTYALSSFKKYKKFWNEIEKKFNEETGHRATSQSIVNKLNALKSRYHRNHMQQLNPHDVELFGILEDLFSNGRKGRSGIRNIAQKYRDNDEGLSVKRAKWGCMEEILFASAVRDGINCGLNGISSGKDITCFKTHRGFWDEVTKKLQEETGMSTSPFQLLCKFRYLRTKLFTKKQHKTLNKHDEQVLGILEQVYSNEKERKSSLNESPNSDAKEVSTDHKMSSENKSTKPMCTPHDCGLSSGYELRTRNKRMKGGLKQITKNSSEKSAMQECNEICLESGGSGDRVQLRAKFSAVKSPAKDGKRSVRKNLDLGCSKEGNHNVDSLPALSGNKRIKQGVKGGLEPKDVIAIANAVQDGMNCGISGLKSARDAMSFRTHEGFWTELNRKFKEETGKLTSAYELFQAFRSSKYKYLNSKRSLIQELSQHDEELFSILEQVFSKNKKQKIGLSGTRLFNANDKLSGALPSGSRGKKKLYRQSGASSEWNSEQRIDVSQDNQTFTDLLSHLTPFADRDSMGELQQPKGEESCPNVFKTVNLPQLASPGAVSCKGGKREATFSNAVLHGMENLDGLKGTRGVKDKHKRPNTQAVPHLEHRTAVYQDNRICKELPCQVPLSADKSGGEETQHPEEEESCLNVLNGINLTFPLVSHGDPLHRGEPKATLSDPVNHGVKNLDVLKDTENARGEYKMLDDVTHTMLNEILPECMQDPNKMANLDGKNEQWNGEQLATENGLSGSKIPEDISRHESDCAEVIKHLERKSRKLQLLQELYRIEQLEVEDRICQEKLKASRGNP